MIGNKNKFVPKEIEDDLRNLERYIEELSVFLPLSVYTVNPSNIIVDTNKAAIDLTGYDEDFIIGKEIVILFKDKKTTEECINQVLEKDLIKNQEMVLIAYDKKEIPVNISISVRKDRKNNVIGYFWAMSDISESKRFQESLEKEVEERTKELREKLEELERFQKIAVGRELKMIELKKEVERLKKS